ncbi:gliding motility-associated lipoprotein GldB [Parabacteroides sp. PF5-5]|uniref:gliding motility lipoprotein GldB n=1 Tax=unclassified Parabacteroides TaxID=2649774 RepID=UPI0024738BFD|nr:MULTISPECIES: DUF2268 domain-containing putative Zn-dependent protease [unclassified Parabacteroides]MDH6304511.1 gliding motility-associated lipoprotein GldB [Parabacteroides sp. PH5-39]MDH6315337.1 gliding motility-associated lipoprotein GldB [Parabacteroides sp. PF5-13]MDH6319169.1 gliding motility-associated lipoprotein GldB [Parabacteroides sp. PH5-13]MDH6322900.1 gliding motility-associated lipoprotein GldB [Parabacteroides sp. PH5-8]MDH6326528.1 gliding motility-associated lipoprotei
MRSIIYLFIALLFSCTSCKSQGNNSFQEAEPIHIERFDQALFQLIESDDPSLQARLLRDYPDMLEVIGKGILNMQSTDMPGFFDRLVNYYSEPTLKDLYHDAISLYDSIEDIEQQLGSGFAYLKASFPSMQTPKIYMHVSGLNQNVLVAENLLSISIDKYMGKTYPLYLDFFYNYQLETMQRSHIAPDYLSGWLLSEYPFTGKENVLLERMIYEGKIKYLVSQALPEMEHADLMGYTEADMEWCRENEKTIWKAIIERKHLYTPDHLTTGKYFERTPSLFLSPDAPGNLGVWIGWQIIQKYVKETAVTPEELMRQTDAQSILTASKYKPF